jgi:WD40 repeat protein
MIEEELIRRADWDKRSSWLSGHDKYVFSVAYSPNGTRIVSGSEDKTLKLWDAETFEELCTLTGHTGAVTDVCFSPDGTRIVSSSADGTIRFWDTSFYRPDERALRYFAAPKSDWHREQATLFETSNNLYAALFHRAWLLKIQPDDPQLYDELHAAHDRWKSTTDGKDVPLPPVVREMLAVPRGKSGTP